MQRHSLLQPMNPQLFFFSENGNGNENENEKKYITNWLIEDIKRMNRIDLALYEHAKSIASTCVI